MSVSSPPTEAASRSHPPDGQTRPAADPLSITGVDTPPKGGDPSLTDQDLQNVVVYLRIFPLSPLPYSLGKGSASAKLSSSSSGLR